MSLTRRATGWLLLGVLAAAGAVLVSSPVGASNWNAVPRFDARMAFTDNARLTPRRGRADTVTRVAPGLDLAMRGSRLTADIGYVLAHDAYVRDRSLDATRHALRGASRAELFADRFFLDIGAFSDDAPASSAGRVPALDRALGGDATGLRGITASPQLRTRLAGLGVGDLRYLVGRVEGYGGNAARRLSGTDIQRGHVSLTQEPEHGRLRWRIEGEHAETRTDGLRAGAPEGVSLRRSGVAARPAFALTRGFDLIGGAGFDRVASRGQTDGIATPAWSAGLRYAPSPLTRIEVAHGRRFGAPDWSVGVAASTQAGSSLEIVHRRAIESQALQASLAAISAAQGGRIDNADMRPGVAFADREAMFDTDDRPYAERESAATLRVARARDIVSLAVSRTTRDTGLGGRPTVTRRVDVATSAALAWSRAMTHTLQADAGVSLARLSTERADPTASPGTFATVTRSARLGIERTIHPALRVGIGAALVRRDISGTAADRLGPGLGYGETVAFVTLRKSF